MVIIYATFYATAVFFGYISKLHKNLKNLHWIKTWCVHSIVGLQFVYSFKPLVTIGEYLQI